MAGKLPDDVANLLSQTGELFYGGVLIHAEDHAQKKTSDKPEATVPAPVATRSADTAATDAPALTTNVKEDGE